MIEWWCEVAVEGVVEVERVEDIIEAMKPVHAFAGTSASEARTTVLFAIPARTLRQAIDEALRLAVSAVRSVGLRGKAVAIEVKPWSDAEAELDKPFLPPLVGVAEVATLLGVTKQRVSTLASEHKDFPRPVARLASGPVWVADWVERFNERWTRRRTGRPPQAVEPAA